MRRSGGLDLLYAFLLLPSVLLSDFKILRGTRAADLPVQLPTEFDFVINMRTQKALGIAISPFLIARATRTID